MATYNKFNSFVENIAEGVHDLESDTLKVMLTNTAPSATNSVKTDITEITAENGYTAGGETATVSSSSQTGGTYKLVLNDIVFTASGGSFGPFRYVVLYDSTAANDPLISWWDYGSSLTLNDAETFTTDFSAANGVIQLS